MRTRHVAQGELAAPRRSRPPPWCLAYSTVKQPFPAMSQRSCLVAETIAVPSRYLFMSGKVDGCGFLVNSTTSRPAASASAGTLPPNDLTSPAVCTVSLKENLPSARSSGRDAPCRK